MSSRTGSIPTAIYKFVGLATIRADHRSEDFMVVTAVEPHDDGTMQIMEVFIEGKAGIFGEDANGVCLWQRVDDDVAREAIRCWLRNPAINEARAMSAAAEIAPE